MSRRKKENWTEPGKGRLRAAVFARDHFTCRHCGASGLDDAGLVRRSAYPAIGPIVPDDYDGRTAVECGDRSGTYPFLTVDHIDPVANGGTTVLDNLQTLCTSCNSRKGARTIEVPA